MPPKEIFLSHAHEDRELADRVADILTCHGLPVWYSPRNIIGARQWHDEIGAALNRCDAFTVLLSPHSVRSMWVKRELLYALQEDRYDAQIVPVLLETCNLNQLSWTLSLFEIVDFTGSFDDGCRDLLRVWGLDYHSEQP